MTAGIPNPAALTPEQRQRLGEVYRIILSWRREPEAADVKPSDQRQQAVEVSTETPIPPAPVQGEV